MRSTRQSPSYQPQTRPSLQRLEPNTTPVIRKKEEIQVKEKQQRACGENALTHAGRAPPAPSSTRSPGREALPGHQIQTKQDKFYICTSCSTTLFEVLKRKDNKENFPSLATPRDEENGSEGKVDSSSLFPSSGKEKKSAQCPSGGAPVRS